MPTKHSQVFKTLKCILTLTSFTYIIKLILQVVAQNMDLMFQALHVKRFHRFYMLALTEGKKFMILVDDYDIDLPMK